MTAPTVAGSAHTQVSPGTTVSLSFTTSANNEVVFFGISTQATTGGAGAPSLSSVAAPGLTVTQYTAAQITNAGSPFGAGSDFNLEIWVAAVPTAGTYTVTATTGSSTNIFLNALWVTNAYDIVSWFDGSLSFPVSGGSIGGGASSTHTYNFSTAQADDLLLLYAVATDSTYNTPSGWTIADGVFAGAGVNYVIYSKTYSSVQTGASVVIAMNNRFGVYPGFVGILIAVTADAKAIALQTFVTTICT